MADGNDSNWFTALLGTLAAAGAAVLGGAKWLVRRGDSKQASIIREQREYIDWLVGHFQKTIDDLEKRYDSLDKRMDALRQEHLSCHVQLAAAHAEINALREKLQEIESEVKRGA